MTTPQNNSLRAQGITPLEYAEIADADTRIFLQRREERILSYTQDMTDSLLAMAGEFRQAKEKLAQRPGPGGQWERWVARFAGISAATADRLADLGRLERSELESLRSGLFARSGGIAGIAAYLNAPAEVQEQVQKGEVPAQQKTIQEAARLFREAQEAQQRAEERERAARLAEATVQEQVDQIRREAQMQGQLAVEQATARLQHDLDEARHQATLRQRDVEEAQQQIQRAQTEWNDRVAYAKKEERDRLEADFTKQMRALQEQLKEQERTARAAQQQAKGLNERLTHARDSDAVRARWDAQAETILSQLDRWLESLPSVIDAQYFENHERVLVESVRKRFETGVARMRELERATSTVVDAG